MIYKLLVILNVLVAAAAQMLLKKGAQNEYKSFAKQYLNIWVISGYCLLGLAMLSNVFALSNGVMVKEVSILESLSYLFVPCLSWMIFKEKITKKKMLAIGVIMFGVIVFFLELRFER